MRAPLLVVVLLVVASLAGCSAPPAGGAALQVQVVLADGAQSRCVKVVVQDAARSRESAAIRVEGRSLLRVAVYQDELGDPVQVQAVGFSDDGCQVPTAPAERSERVEGFFTLPISTVTVTLRPQASPDGGPSDAGADDAGAPDAGADDAGPGDAGPGDAGADDAGAGDAGVDLDRDGYSPPEDCDDTNAAINPDAGELCTGGVDEDCDGLIDCADPDCLNRACGVNGTCLVGGTCQAPTEAGLCGDGLDNDADGLIDCEDPDCPAGAACSDFNACTLVDVCGGADAGCVAGSDVMCLTPPAQCFEAAGACLPDAGTCSYAVRMGSCDDGLACTTADTCLADGGCVGGPQPCTTPPGVCLAAVGSCEEPSGACTYAPLPPGPCSDGENCTVNDSCDGAGGCVGTPVTCTAPTQCLATTGTCDPDGGCLFAALTGQACDAGTGTGSCSDAGACVLPPAVFPYVPSNFTEAQLPTTGGAMTFDCGVTVLDTQASDGGVAWTNRCAAIAEPSYALVTVGSQQAVLLFAESLSVPSGNTLRAVGARPLIVAVRTTASIGGVVEATSDRNARRGAGANLDCGLAGVGGLGGNGGVASNRSGGGGGGAFGADGANGAQGNGGGAGGLKGLALGSSTLVPLRGGCAGGNGGRATTGNAGIGGFGGGALQLSVAGGLSLLGTGRVSASGGGGRGGPQSGSDGEGLGGGGGGSGGGALLEAATISLAVGSAVTANGGGGGEGNGVSSNGGAGGNGPVATGLQAPGGNTSSCGGNGGSGGAVLGGAGPGSQETCNTSNAGSGGGGGGGVGRIRLNASTSCTLLGTLSPLPSGNGATGCPVP